MLLQGRSVPSGSRAGWQCGPRIEPNPARNASGHQRAAAPAGRDGSPRGVQSRRFRGTDTEPCRHRRAGHRWAGAVSQCEQAASLW